MKSIPILIAAAISLAASLPVHAETMQIPDGTKMDMPMDQPPSGDPRQLIPDVLKTMFETPEKPLAIGPVAVHGTWAIAGWQQDGRGGRILLQNGAHGWRPLLCSGDAIRETDELAKAGIPADVATALAAALKDAEAQADPKALQAFASFEGTVTLGAATASAAHSGHEGHGK
ncbi:copper uptake system-associated protein [Rhizobium sp. BE258]|uniref:copper uptake system-associated protein n=1 Tax=Rhizobium sp. BE258 TaxID=2817722 RepID=UPI00286286AE|nr:copper uptake system-associated protein [Rhizobium sp. BE258]MDR7142902.1 hypothetical protein [Rhizobium sp. BE258]